MDAAILVADISGFTKLTESLSQRDAAGVELLTKCINSFFGQIIEVVLHHGGDVMRFAGDSIICCFIATSEEGVAPERRLQQATLRCLQCASALVKDLGECHLESGSLFLRLFRHRHLISSKVVLANPIARLP